MDRPMGAAKAVILGEDTHTTLVELKKRMSDINGGLVEIEGRLFGPSPLAVPKRAEELPTSPGLRGAILSGTQDLREAMEIAQSTIGEILRQL